ncbi:MAG TPA: hypothetical protein VGR60_02740 [Gemmatimonadales bacterium]|nr:hypothetical protein [Gemmatimonadales bacterium]
MLDLRVPIGGLFALVGAMLLAYGLLHGADPALSPTGMPIVTIWGAVQLVAGLGFLAGARWKPWRKGE